MAKRAAIDPLDSENGSRTTVTESTVVAGPTPRHDLGTGRSGTTGDPTTAASKKQKKGQKGCGIGQQKASTVLADSRSNSRQSATVVVATGAGGGGAAGGPGSQGVMQRCGLCSLLSRLLRRAMCVGSRRGSGESYYQELDTTNVSNIIKG